MTDPIPFRRPVRWTRLRADEAERIVRKRAEDSANIFIGDHAFDRIDEREIILPDVYDILRTGYVEGQPVKEGDDWVVVVTKRMAAGREAGVVTIVFSEEDGLFVKTVQWMDYTR